MSWRNRLDEDNFALEQILELVSSNNTKKGIVLCEWEADGWALTPWYHTQAAGTGSHPSSGPDLDGPASHLDGPASHLLHQADVADELVSLV